MTALSHRASESHRGKVTLKKDTKGVYVNLTTFKYMVGREKKHPNPQLCHLPLSQCMLCPESAQVLHKLGFHSRCSDGNQGHPRTRQKSDDKEALALTQMVSSSNNILQA